MFGFSKTQAVTNLEILKRFEPPGVSLRHQLTRGPFDPSFHANGGGMGVWGFKKRVVTGLFEIFRMFDSPVGV